MRSEHSIILAAAASIGPFVDLSDSLPAAMVRWVRRGAALLFIRDDLDDFRAAFGWIAIVAHDKS